MRAARRVNKSRRVVFLKLKSMATLPKTSVEILAAAKPLSQKERQPRKPKTNLKTDFKTLLSTFSVRVNPSAGTNDCAAPSLPLQPSPITSNAFSISSTYFNNPITPQTLEGALKLKEMKGVEEMEDLFDDEPADTFLYSIFYVSYLFLLSEAFTSEPDSPTDSISSTQSRISLSDRILDVLALLRRHRLSPFDLVLNILDEENYQYYFYRNEFYKEGNEKLWRFLNILISSESGKKKLRPWFRQPKTVDLFCAVVTEEMNAVQKAELLPGIAAITPDFIRNWTVSSHQELAPCLMHILLAAAQTPTAKEKNKVKKPDMVC